MHDVPPIVGWAAIASLALAAAATAFAFRSLASVPAPTAVPVDAPPVVDGPWVSYVASARTCPGGDDAAAPPAAQEATMRCLLDHARRRRGLAPLVRSPALDTSAALKAADVVRCARFAHDPCGAGSAEVFERVRYGAGAGVWAHGENLALVSTEGATPRYVLNGWLESDGHRENLFRPDWVEGGLSLVPGADVGPLRGVNVWASHFGYRR